MRNPGCQRRVTLPHATAYETVLALRDAGVAGPRSQTSASPGYEPDVGSRHSPAEPPWGVEPARNSVRSAEPTSGRSGAYFVSRPGVGPGTSAFGGLRLHPAGARGARTESRTRSAGLEGPRVATTYARKIGGEPTRYRAAPRRVAADVDHLILGSLRKTSSGTGVSIPDSQNGILSASPSACAAIERAR